MSATPQQPVTDAGYFHRTFRAFHYSHFRLMWSGAFTSTTGAFVQEVAQSWLVYQLTNDPFLLGLTVFLNNGPILVLSLFGGVAADRMDRRKLLIASQLIQMTAALALASLIWTGQIQIWHILAAAFFTGVGQAFGGPAYQALIPSLVDKPDVPNAVALMSIQFNLAGVVGPAIGGIAMKELGTAWCFLINGLSFLAVIFSLLMLPASFTPNKQKSDVLHSLREGLSFVFRHPAMLPLIVLGIATAFLAVPVRTLLPVFAKDTFRVEAEGFSYLMAAFGSGGVAGALSVAFLGNREHKGTRTLILQIALGVFTLGFGLAANLWLGGALLFGIGYAVLFVFASVSSLIQLLAPEDMRGRIMSVLNTAFRGSMALGPPFAGFLSRSFGAPAVIAANGALLVLVAAGFFVRSRRVREL
jgi:MFS family permease